MKKIKLNTGDKVYNYVSPVGIFEYEVIGFKETDNFTEYIVRCNSCNHGYKCELMIIQCREDRLKYVQMLNDPDCEQDYWHEDGRYFLTSDKCKEDYILRLIEDKKKLIVNNETILTRLQNELKTFEEAVRLFDYSTVFKKR